MAELAVRIWEKMREKFPEREQNAAAPAKSLSQKPVVSVAMSVNRCCGHPPVFDPCGMQVSHRS